MDLAELYAHVGNETGQPAVMAFLAAGGDINAAKASSGWTLLHLAVEHQNHALIRLLVGHGANLNARDHQGWTPLHLAVDVDIDSVIQAGGAASDSGLLTAQLLLSLGADATTGDAAEMTPRDVAAGYGSDMLARYDAVISAL